MTQSAPTRPSLSVAQWLLALLGLSGVVHTLAVVFHWGGEGNQVLMGDLISIPVSLLAAILLGWVARQHSGTSYRPWMLIALAALAYVAGDTAWAYIELVLGQDPFPSLADGFYLLYPVLLLLGFLLFPRTPLKPLEALKLGLDVAIIVLAVGVYAWNTFLAHTIQSYGSDWVSLWVSLAYPVMDLALLSLLLLLMLGRHNSNSVEVVFFMGLGLASLVLADTLYNVQSATDSYQSGTLMDTGWSWANVCFGLAGYFSLIPPKRWSQRLWLMFKPSKLAFYTPYLAIGLSYGLLIINQSVMGLKEFGVLLGAGLVTLMVVVRQTLAYVENARLTNQLQAFSYELERRVEERTRELEESRERLIASEKLANMGKLTAGLAHEINTPLAAAMNHLLHARELADEYQRSIGAAQVTPEDHREIAAELQTVLGETSRTLERLGEFIRRVRNQGRNPVSQASTFDPLKMALETLGMLEQQAREAEVSLHLEAPKEALTLYGEPGRFSQILTNLVVNAIHACEARRAAEGSRVDIRLGLQGGQFQLAVSDNGSGIPAEVRPRIFEPLFTTKPEGKGTGLGLSIIHDIVKGHFGGEVHFNTQPGRGTTFVVEIPYQPVEAVSG